MLLQFQLLTLAAVITVDVISVSMARSVENSLIEDVIVATTQGKKKRSNSVHLYRSRKVLRLDTNYKPEGGYTKCWSEQTLLR